MIRFKIALTAVAAGLLMGLGTARAQERLAPVPDFSGQERAEFARAAHGGASLGENADALLTKAAKYYVNRLTQTENQQARGEGSTTPTMDRLVQEALGVIPTPPSAEQPLNDAQQSFVEEYSKHLVVELANVLKNPEPIARVNAARILAQLGRAGAAPAAALMIKSIAPNNKQIEAVKLYCFRGLGDLLLYGGDNLKPDQKAGIVQALIDYITAPHPPADPKHPLPGELDAHRYIRRAAVRALARWHIPAGENGKTPAALVLMRVMAADGLTPSPSMSERVAAAIGLCHMLSRKYDAYQPQYAAYQVGRFVTSFLDAYNKDQNHTPRSQAWKLLAARLDVALTALRDDKKDPYISKVVEQIHNRLSQVNGEQTVDPSELATWLDSNQPPEAKSLYKDDPASVVRAGAGG